MPQCHLLLHAAHIVTQDAQRRVVRQGALAISHGLVADVGPAAELDARWQADRRLDLGDSLVLPGLVNAHTHAAMTFLRGLADDMPLMDWLEQRVFPVERQLTARIVRLSSLLGFAEMLRTGTTACQDMYIFAHAVLDAAEAAGLRCLAGEGVFMFPSAACSDAGAAFTATRALAERCQGRERLRTAVMPHSVYTTTPELLMACRALARELDLPLHLHLAETAEETRRCLDAHGQRPTAYCHGLGLFDGPCSLAHVVDVTPEEVALLARQGCVAVHNPSSNMKLASGVAPVPLMRERGLVTALGTDGAASNNRLNMFTELRSAALLHKLAGMDSTLLPAGAALDMATLGGAAALGDERLGRLAPGSAADLLALDLREPNLQPLHNAVSQAVYAATGMENRLTMVGGEVLYDRGRFTRFNYGDVLAELEDIRAFVRRTAGLDGAGAHRPA